MSTTIVHAKAADILLDEFDFSGLTNEVELAVNNGLADVTAFLDTDATFVEGKAGWRATVNGLWDGTGGYDAEMFTDLTATSRRLGIWPDTAAAGKRGWEGSTIVGRQPRVAPVADAVALNVDWIGDSPIMAAWSLMNANNLNSTTTGTAYNAGAAAAGETIVGVLRITEVGGAGANTLDVTIQSDDAEGFVSPTTRLTFTQVGTVVTFEMQSAAGAVADTWWRAVATYAGAGSRTYDVVVTFGIRST